MNRETPAIARRASAQCLRCLSNTSIVFPVAAVVVVLLSFLTEGPSPGIVGLFAAALTPWALVAGGVRLPAMVVTLWSIGPVAVLVVHYNDQAALFLPIVAIAWASAQGLRSPTLTGVAGGTAMSIWCDMAHTAPGDHGAWGIWTTGMFFGWFAGSLLHRQRLLTEELSVARHELGLAAAADARKQIAREVHDIVGHSLTVVPLNISGARRHLASNPSAAAAALEQAESVSRESLESVRTVVGLLSSGNDSQTDAPLPNGADILPVIEQARRSGLPVVLTVQGEPAELEPAVGLTLVRLLQEALSNAHRHAPTSPVEITIDVDAQVVSAIVANDLSDPPTASSRAGLGLASMRERVAAVHGALEVGPRDGRWIVRCALPRSLHRSELSPA